jgi:hypothetical protein
LPKSIAKELQLVEQKTIDIKALNPPYIILFLAV